MCNVIISIFPSLCTYMLFLCALHMIGCFKKKRTVYLCDLNVVCGFQHEKKYAHISNLSLRFRQTVNYCNQFWSVAKFVLFEFNREHTIPNMYGKKVPLVPASHHSTHTNYNFDNLRLNHVFLFHNRNGKRN